MIISYILHTGEVSVASAWGWVVMLSFTAILFTFSNATSAHGEFLLGISARTVLSAQIYQKVI